MKKFITILVLAIGLVTGTAQAQTKIGYLRIDDIVGLMPEVKAVNMDTVGQKYVTDSVLPRYNYIQSEYNRKISDLNDTAKNPLAVRTQILKEMQDDKTELDNAQSTIQQILQYKQSEFLQPFYEKAKKAINAVAKEKGYVYVLSTETFLVAPETDDLTLLVLAKLNIKLPEQKPAVTPPAGNKPAAKTGN